MKTLFTLAYSFLLFVCTLSAQEWQQTGSTPEGAGVTEIVVLQESGHIFVTTASFDWPNGDGGVRRSTDDGDTWDNVFDAYNGRTITAGEDGYLYASVWPFPDDEGLYRSSDNGDTWDLLVTVPSGNNIFSITASIATNPVTLFAGTRNGVLRSTDNGATWAFSSSGIPSGSWVRDIEVDFAGNVAAGTSSGLFISTDNGADWMEATGDGIENETVTKLVFDYPFGKAVGKARLFSGTSFGKLFEASDEDNYIVNIPVHTFGSSEISGLRAYVNWEQEKKVQAVTQYPTGSVSYGFARSLDLGVTWEQDNEGLPGDPPQLSALSGYTTDTQIKFRVGMFQNLLDGALVYKLSYDWEDIPTGIEDIGFEYLAGIALYQNIPNPFNQSTLISYFLENAGQVNLSVYAADGQLVSKLIDNRQSRGEHQITFNAEKLTDGIYYYRLETDGNSEVKKMVVLR